MMSNKTGVHFYSSISLFRRFLPATAEVTGAMDDISHPEKRVRLYKRLSALGATGRTVAQTLDEYVTGGRVVTKVELQACIRGLRKYKKYQHALEILDWMKFRFIKFSCTDCALRLDLVSKTKGIIAAEEYFESLSPAAKNLMTYGALLNCYCKERMEDRALTLFQKMDELKYASTSLSFNNIMTLYMRLGQPEKVPPLVDEMKKRNIELGTYTTNILMQSYTCLNDIQGVERVFEEIKNDSKCECSWSTYASLAAFYVKVQLFEKAEKALKEVEKAMIFPERTAYHFMITLYAGTSNLAEVKRSWHSLNSALPVTNNLSYLVLLQSLAKLDDVDGVREYFEQWKSRASLYDKRLAYNVIQVYLNHGMIEDAEAVFREATERTTGLLFRARTMFVDFYLKNRRVDMAMGHMKAALADVKSNEWRPSSEITTAFLKYFEEEGDVDGAEEFCKILKKVNCLDSNAYQMLLQTYVTAGRLASDMRKRIEEDGVKPSGELESLLQAVSAQ